MGGYRVQARTAETARKLEADAPRAGSCRRGGNRARRRSARGCRGHYRRALPIPTIRGRRGVRNATGRFSVFHDLVNLSFAPQAKFVRRYADASALFQSAIERYREDVEHRAFPADAESYHLSSSAVRQGGASAALYLMAGDAGTEFDSERRDRKSGRLRGLGVADPDGDPPALLMICAAGRGRPGPCPALGPAISLALCQLWARCMPAMARLSASPARRVPTLPSASLLTPRSLAPARITCAIRDLLTLIALSLSLKAQM